jgi:hypothetical protein
MAGATEADLRRVGDAVVNHRTAGRTIESHL